MKRKSEKRNSHPRRWPSHWIRWLSDIQSARPVEKVGGGGEGGGGQTVDLRDQRSGVHWQVDWKDSVRFTSDDHIAHSRSEASSFTFSRFSLLRKKFHWIFFFSCEIKSSVCWMEANKNGCFIGQRVRESQLYSRLEESMSIRRFSFFEWISPTFHWKYLGCLSTNVMDLHTDR